MEEPRQGIQIGAGINCSQENDVEATAIFIAILVCVFIAICLPFFLSGKQWREAEDKARARRIADAKMNARLLRLNI
jgi:hypothetical protein